MRMRLKPAAARVLEPFAVFGIIVGVTAKLIIPILESSIGISVVVGSALFRAGWLIGALCGLLYVGVLLRHLWQSSTGEKFLYMLLLLIFAALTLFTPIMGP